MGYVIKDNKVQKAKKVVLSLTDRKIVFTQIKEQKEELSKGITELFAKIFNGRGAKSAVVIIEEVSTDNYSIGGKTITQIREESK